MSTLLPLISRTTLPFSSNLGPLTSGFASRTQFILWSQYFQAKSSVAATQFLSNRSAFSMSIPTSRFYSFLLVAQIQELSKPQCSASVERLNPGRMCSGPTFFFYRLFSSQGTDCIHARSPFANHGTYEWLYRNDAKLYYTPCLPSLLNVKLDFLTQLGRQELQLITPAVKSKLTSYNFMLPKAALPSAQKSTGMSYVSTPNQF